MNTHTPAESATDGANTPATLVVVRHPDGKTHLHKEPGVSIGVFDIDGSVFDDFSYLVGHKEREAFLRTVNDVPSAVRTVVARAIGNNELANKIPDQMYAHPGWTRRVVKEMEETGEVEGENLFVVAIGTTHLGPQYFSDGRVNIVELKAQTIADPEHEVDSDHREQLTAFANLSPYLKGQVRLDVRPYSPDVNAADMPGAYVS